MRSAPAVHRVCYPVTERWPVKWLEEEVGKHGVSVWRERQLVFLVFGVGGVSSLSQPTQRALMWCLWTLHRHSETQSPVCVARRRNQCSKACLYRRQLYYSRLAVNRGSRLDFTPRPTLFFLPAGFCCLVSSIEETPSARLSKLENYGFDQLVSQRDWHHLLNEKSGFWGTCLSWRDVRGRIYEGCVGEVANRMSGGSFRGGRWRYLPFRHHDNRYSADWIRLYPGLSKNSEDGNSCSKSHKAARFDWSCGKSGQQWDWDYKPEYGYHHDETRCFGSEIWWFQRSEWTKRMSCGNFAAVRPKSHNNLILSFWLPVPAPWPRPSGFTTLRERCSEDSLAPFPHYRHYSPPPFNCLWNALYRH